MATAIETKQALLNVIEAADGDGLLDEGSFLQLQSLMVEMEQISPISDPIDRPDKVDGSWKTVFASFGPRHTAGRPQRHQTSLKLQSFNALPDVAINVTDIYQEIDSGTGAYNNIMDFDTVDGKHHGRIIVSGAYSRDETNPKRFHVVFYRAHVEMGDEDAPAIRYALGLPGDGVVDGQFRASKIYSDIVYLDDDIRVNKGSMGGTYVLAKQPGPCVSF